MTILYNDPIGGTKSSVDGSGSDQINEKAYWRKAIIDNAPEIVFSRLTSTKEIPAHYGKTIEAYVHFPILDDRNQNDQGIDAAGVTYANGNMWGSSKDIGTINDKLPLLTEEGGRVNRVGVTRLKVSGSIQDYGFFMEFSSDSLNFDTEADLFEYLSNSAMEAAIQIYETVLCKDLLANAGTVLFTGEATSDATMTGETGVTPSLVNYNDLMTLSTTLDDNRTPKHTKIIKGSRMTDTRTIRDGRLMYIGSELTRTVRDMQDNFGNEAFIPTSKYADASNILDNEIGNIDQFRLLVPQNMLFWAGAGAAVTDNDGYRETDTAYDIYPMLVIGEDSFVTLSFFENGRSEKYKSITKMPGEATADFNNPYGKKGFMSMSWWYGFLAKRPERIGLIKTLAKA